MTLKRTLEEYGKLAAVTPSFSRDSINATVFQFVHDACADIATLSAANTEMIEALDECEDYLETLADTVTGDDGTQEPNKAMQLLRKVRDALKKAGA